MIYGIGKSKLGTSHLKVTCFFCNKDNSVNVEVYGRYFHLVFLPFFPIGKTGTSCCANCGQTLTKKQFNFNYSRQFDIVKSQFKIPKWHFSWLFVWLLAAPIFFYFQTENEKEDKAYIASPLLGDIYEIRENLVSYTLYRVLYFTKDSIYFSPSKLRVYKKRSLSDDDINLPGNFEENRTIGLSKKEIVTMREINEIQDIRRD
jgi:hypothetical protein